MRLLNYLLINILLVLSCLFTSAQDETKYKSKEEDEYYKKSRKTWEYKKFVPVNLETAKKIPFDFIKVIKVDNPASYNPGQVSSSYLDSIMTSQKDNLNDYVKFESLLQNIKNEKVGNVSKMSIIKQERFGNRWAIIYTDSKYDDFIYGGWGYWLSLSYDNGKSWKDYYTGLTENCYYFFKRNSKISLWRDSSTLQIESTIVRQISEVMHPLPAEFETIQDGLAVQLNIPKITLDSDNDGLTDIAEDKLMLNPKNSDTDGDGISDFIDKNPRFKSVKSEKSIIYETLVENFHPDKNGEMEIDISNPAINEREKNNPLYADFESVSIFVTDDTELQGLNLHNVTMIIMTSAEYEEYKLKYPSHFIKSSFSPMFKCDRLVDTYKIGTSLFTGGSTYLIQKTKKGWKISMLSSWIS